jgi:hypothetical protein
MIQLQQINYPLILGTFDLSAYVSEEHITQLQNDTQLRSELERLTKTIEHLRGPEGADIFPSEVEVFPVQLCERKAEIVYPELNLDFLKIGNKTDKDFNFPRFAVYPLFGSQEMKINIDAGNLPFMVGAMDHSIGIISSVPKFFERYLLFSLFDKEVKSNILGGEWLYVLKKCSANWEYNLTSTFRGLIPRSTKEKVKESLSVFNKEDLYLITEVKPEEWNVVKINTDPLLAGVVNERCFLIDKFDTTPLEEIISQEFIKRNQEN